ncbi:MAG TPA: hypothetical protein VK096_07130 [Actinomycetales bacterium]|nr:hypothetical protein [Actinomycetales bacterium]
MLAGLRSRRRLAWAGFAALVLTLATFLYPFTARANGGEVATNTEETRASAAPAAANNIAVPEGSPLIIVGVGGLVWPNISAEDTPTLWELLEDPATSAGAVTVHTDGQPVCPAGGWLALSSGRPTPSPRLGSLCVEPYRTRAVGDGGQVVDWQQAQESLTASSFEPRLGTLRAMLDEGEVSAQAVGPGAALTLADTRGWVENYSRTITTNDFDQQLTVIDVGSTFAEDLSGRSMRQVDSRIEKVLKAAPEDATILITSVSAPEGARVQLGVALLRQPGAETGHFLTSTATRWDGVVRLLDLPPTIAETFDQPRPADFGGAPLRLGTERPGAAETIDTLADISVRDMTLRRMSGPVAGVLEVSTFVLILFLVWKPWDRRHDSPRKLAERMANSARAWVRNTYRRWRATRTWATENLRLRRLMSSARARPLLGKTARWIGAAVAMFFALFPVSLYLMGAIPWWDLGSPGVGAWLTLISWSILLGGIVAAIPWRSPWQAIAVISLVSATVMGLDAIVGSPLHRGSPMGPSPIYGGRFYGFGNTTYSFFVVHTLVLATAAAAPAARAGRKLLSYGIVAGIGIIALVIDVAPTWGADIGGGLALIPAFAFLAMVLNRARFTLMRVLAIGLGTIGIILGIAFVDWLRPAASRSHAGQFFEQLITGDAWQIIWRKAQYALNTLDTGLASRLTLILLVLAVLALIKPERFAPATMRDALAAYPVLRIALGAILIGLIAGAGLNDYGLRIVSLGFATTAPLLALMTTPTALPRTTYAAHAASQEAANEKAAQI